MDNPGLLKWLLDWLLPSVLIILVFTFLGPRLMLWLDYVRQTRSTTSDTHSGFRQRVLALWLDYQFLLIPITFLYALSIPKGLIPGGLQSWIFFSLFGLKVFSEYRFGFSPGKWLLGLRIEAQDPGKGSLPSMALRNLPVALLVLAGTPRNRHEAELQAMDFGIHGLLGLALMVVLLLDGLWYYNKARGLMLHDQLAGTRVIKAGPIHPRLLWVVATVIILGQLADKLGAME